jgi:hypothetical protein
MELLEGRKIRFIHHRVTEATEKEFFVCPAKAGQTKRILFQ